jgi:hypothetical protein
MIFFQLCFVQFFENGVLFHSKSVGSADCQVTFMDLMGWVVFEASKCLLNGLPQKRNVCYGVALVSRSEITVAMLLAFRKREKKMDQILD